MNLELKNREWESFNFSEIFIIEKGFYNKKPPSTKNGKIPFLGATATNNGITQFNTQNDISLHSKMGHGINHDISKKLFKGNCIAVTNNGSVGYAYYQKTAFSCSHDINPLYLKNYTLNTFLAKFLISAIEKQRVCFEYSRKWRPKRMLKSKILLPITAEGQPDYVFMETYMRQKEQEKLNEYQTYITKRLEQLGREGNSISPLSEVRWLEFEIGKLFHIKAGKRLTKHDMKRGNKPFVGSSDNNNGITAYVCNSNVSEDRNILGVNYNGSVVENFYHPYTAVFSDDVKKLAFNKIEGNQHSYLFVKIQILKQKEKFQYGYKFNATRMKKQKIMLPVNAKGQPDYSYMENYSKQLERKMLIRYCQHKGFEIPNGTAC